MIYLYCLVEHTIKFDLTAFNLYTIQFESFLAVVESIEDEAYSEAELNKNLENAEWVIQHAQRHAKVIDSLQKDNQVIPMRFPSVFNSEVSLRLALQNHKDYYQKLLNFIQNKTEWTLRLWIDEHQLSSALYSEQPEIQAIELAINQATPGKAFILKKQKESLLANLRPKVYQQLGGKILNQIALDCFNYKIVPNQDLFNVSVSQLKLILKVICLVEELRVEKLKKNIDILNQQYNSEGIQLELNGPFAVFNFLD